MGLAQLTTQKSLTNSGHIGNMMHRHLQTLQKWEPSTYLFSPGGSWKLYDLCSSLELHTVKSRTSRDFPEEILGDEQE